MHFFYWRVGRGVIKKKFKEYFKTKLSVLWSRSRPEPDFLAGAGEKAPTLGRCCLA